MVNKKQYTSNYYKIERKKSTHTLTLFAQEPLMYSFVHFYKALPDFLDNQLQLACFNKTFFLCKTGSLPWKQRLPDLWKGFWSRWSPSVTGLLRDINPNHIGVRYSLIVLRGGGDIHWYFFNWNLKLMFTYVRCSEI